MRSMIAATLFFFGIACTVLRSQSTPDIDLPNPPEGLAWQLLPEVRGACLLPSGWYFRAEESDANTAYFLTVENIAEAGSFQTGMTVNVVRNIDKRTGKRARTYALDFIQARKKMGKETVLLSKEVRRGIFAGALLRSSAPRPEGGNAIIHTLVLGNTRTQTLYLLIFESPESSWEEAWKLGQVMLERYVFDEGV